TRPYGRRPSTISLRDAGVGARCTTRGTRTGAAVGVETVGDGAVVTPVVVVAAEPVETLTVTAEPLSTSLLAGGFWPTTVPAGCEEGTLCRTGLSPSFVS